MISSKRSMLSVFLKGSGRLFTAAVVFACLSSFSEMLRPVIIKYTVDGIISRDVSSLPGYVRSLLEGLGGAELVFSHLWLSALAVIAVTAISAFFQYVYRTSAAKAGEKMVRTMRDALFSKLMGLGAFWYSQHRTGDIIQRCTSDVEEIKNFISDQMVTLLSMCLTIVFALAFMCRENLILGGIALVSIPAVLCFSLWFHAGIQRAFLECDRQEGKLSSIAQENLTGVRVVRAFGREAFEQERFEEQNTIVTAEWNKLNRFLCSYWFAGDLISGCATLAILCTGSVLCVRGKLSVGSFIAILGYLAILSRPLRMLGRVISEMSKAGVSLERLHEIMSSEDEASPKEAECPPMNGDISLSHVSFSYPGGEELLHDISFTVPAGTTLGILGATGSGKSTLAHLMSKLYPLPDGCGAITVGGRDLRDISTSWVRKNVSYVLPEAFLFSRSIAENISITDPGMKMSEIEHAAEIACFHQTVTKFPKGYDTFVGERGVTLSGGQKQRASIARSLTLNSPIIIFDDSLSAVDAETDEKIRRNLSENMGDATVIIISHRIPTLMSADKIIVLEDGRITQEGTHEELSSVSGLYRTICDIQQGKEDDLS